MDKNAIDDILQSQVGVNSNISFCLATKFGEFPSIQKGITQRRKKLRKSDKMVFSLERKYEEWRRKQSCQKDIADKLSNITSFGSQRQKFSILKPAVVRLSPISTRLSYKFCRFWQFVFNELCRFADVVEIKKF